MRLGKVIEYVWKSDDKSNIRGPQAGLVKQWQMILVLLDGNEDKGLENSLGSGPRLSSYWYQHGNSMLILIKNILAPSFYGGENAHHSEIRDGERGVIIKFVDAATVIKNIGTGNVTMSWKPYSWDDNVHIPPVRRRNLEVGYSLRLQWTWPRRRRTLNNLTNFFEPRMMHQCVLEVGTIPYKRQEQKSQPEVLIGLVGARGLY